jgi:hypothetical protein
MIAPFSDSYAIQNTTTCSDPDVVGDDYSLFGERLLVHWYVGALKPMIEWNNDGVGTDHRIASDHQTSMFKYGPTYALDPIVTVPPYVAMMTPSEIVTLCVKDDLTSELPAI